MSQISNGLSPISNAVKTGIVTASQRAQLGEDIPNPVVIFTPALNLGQSLSVARILYARAMTNLSISSAFMLAIIPLRSDL